MSEGQLRLIAGDRAAARELMDRAMDLVPPESLALPMTRTIQALASAMRGETAAAKVLIDVTVERYLASDEWFACWGVWIHALIGDRAGVLKWMDCAIGRGVTNDRWWGELDPVVAPFRADPGFQALVAKARALRQANPR